MGNVLPAICQYCLNCCGVLAEIEDGRIVKITGDHESPLHQGYACVKGRSIPGILNGPDRLLHSLKRQSDGSFVEIPAEQVMDEVASRLQVIIDEHGPTAVAGYGGTMQGQMNLPFIPGSFLDAIDTPLRFDPMTIDQPGKLTARALHGTWMAPAQGFDAPDAALIIGANPLISVQGVPPGNPGAFFSRGIENGMELIVIDPRRTDTAKRATLFLQPKPGEDATILAGLIRVMIEDDLVDHDFVRENVDGIEGLRQAVAPFTPDYVARRADLPAADIVRAGQLFGRARRAYAMAGTGPSMAAARSTLLEYLVLCLTTLGGHWLRAGERARNVSTLMPAMPPKAQATPPANEPGHQLRVRGLRGTAAGMPTAALADEILLDGPGQVKALICNGGNPVAAWPDQLKTAAAMKELDLLVALDITMTATTQFADYIVATKIGPETATSTFVGEALGRFIGFGYMDSFAQYVEAIVEPPPGSDVIEEWEFYYGVAQRMGLQLSLPGADRVSWVGAASKKPQSGATADEPPDPNLLDMNTKPTTEELLSRLYQRGRVPLDEVKKHKHGSFFPDPPVHVQPKDDGWEGRLDIGNADMLRDLGEVAGEPFQVHDPSSRYPLRLIPRRSMQSFNSSVRNVAGATMRTYNPAFLNSSDLRSIGVRPGDLVEIESERASIHAIVEVDETLRNGLVSMTHAYGDVPERDAEVRHIGSAINRLLSVDVQWERYSGQPLMGNVPIRIRPIPIPAHAGGRAPAHD